MKAFLALALVGAMALDNAREGKPSRTIGGGTRMHEVEVQNAHQY